MLQIFAGDGRAERQPLSGDAELDESFVDGVHPAAKPGRDACTCLVRSARAAPPRRCRTGPPARVPDASGESLVPLVCETAHTSIGGSERRLGPRLAPRKAPRRRQPVSGSASPDPAHPPELAQRAPVLTGPRRPSWLGRSQMPTSLRARTADHTPRRRGRGSQLPIPLQQSGRSWLQHPRLGGVSQKT